MLDISMNQTCESASVSQLGCWVKDVNHLLLQTATNPSGTQVGVASIKTVL